MAQFAPCHHFYSRHPGGPCLGLRHGWGAWRMRGRGPAQAADADLHGDGHPLASDARSHGDTLEADADRDAARKDMAGLDADGHERMAKMGRLDALAKKLEAGEPTSEKEIFDLLLREGWRYHAEHRGGYCRWCHKETHFAEILISPRGTIYHRTCAIRRRKGKKGKG